MVSNSYNLINKMWLWINIFSSILKKKNHFYVLCTDEMQTVNYSVIILEN